MTYEQASENLRRERYGFTGKPTDNVDSLPWWLRSDTVVPPTARKPGTQKGA